MLRSRVKYKMVLAQVSAEIVCGVVVEEKVFCSHELGELYQFFFVCHRHSSASVLTVHNFDISSESTWLIMTKLSMHDPLDKGFQSCTNWGSGAKNRKIRSNFKNLLLQN